MVCPILDKPYALKGIGEKREDLSKSVDRFDPSQGYTLNNMVIMSDRANRLKNNGTAEEHLRIGIWMLLHTDTSPEHITNTISDLIRCIGEKKQ